MSAGALDNFLRDIGETGAPSEEQAARLTEIAKRYKELLGQLEASGSADPEVRRLKAEARTALDRGDFAQAEALLNQAKTLDLAAAAQMQADVDARMYSAAEAAAGNGDLMMAQLRYVDASKYYEEAKQILPDNMNSTFGVYLIKLGLAKRFAGKYNEAIEYFKMSIDVSARISSSFKFINSDFKDYILISKMNLCILYRLNFNFQAAEEMCVAALRASEQFNPESVSAASALGNLALL